MLSTSPSTYESRLLLGANLSRCPTSITLHPVVPHLFQVPRSSLGLCLPALFNPAVKEKRYSWGKRSSHYSYPRPLLEFQELKGQRGQCYYTPLMAIIFRPLTDSAGSHASALSSSSTPMSRPSHMLPCFLKGAPGDPRNLSPDFREPPGLESAWHSACRK